MLKPDWQTEDGSIRLFCANCMTVLPQLDAGSVDAVVTDPNYGIKRDGKRFSTSSHGGHKGYEFLRWDSKRPSKESFLFMLAAARFAIIWGGQYFADLLPPCPKWLVWDKGQRINQADAELAWTNLPGVVRVMILNRVALMQDGAVHPTQKPLALMLWCLSQLPNEHLLSEFGMAPKRPVAILCAARKTAYRDIPDLEIYIRSHTIPALAAWLVALARQADVSS